MPEEKITAQLQLKEMESRVYTKQPVKICFVAGPVSENIVRFELIA